MSSLDDNEDTVYGKFLLLLQVIKVNLLEIKNKFVH
jgi:hypothetical protein